MKKMITAVAALLMSAATFAQSATSTPAATPTRQTASPEQRAKQETDRINALTPLGASYDKVLAVNTDFATKRMAIKGGTTAAPTEDMKNQVKALNDEHKKNLEAAMGADTYAKYEAAMKAKREERKEMRSQQAPVKK